MERYLLFDSLFLTFFFMLAQELLAQEALTRPWWHDSKLWKARPSWWQPRFFSLLEEEQDFSGSGLECQRSSSRLWVWFSLSYSRLRKKWESCQTSFGLEVQQNFSAMEMTLLNCVLPWDFLLLCKSWAFRRTVVKGSVDLWEHLQACRYPVSSVQFSSVAHSCLTLRRHELQHARPPCPSPTPGVHTNPCPLSWWCHPTISSSVVPFSSCPQSFPASGSFPMSQLFASGGQSKFKLELCSWGKYALLTPFRV